MAYTAFGETALVLKRFFDEKLAQASYLLGCSKSGEAIVIDPNRDIEQYLAAAEDAGVQIVAVTETHIHADFVSGSRELAYRAEAVVYLSGEGGEDWTYTFAADRNVRLLHDGDLLAIGALRIVAMHTPGHTPEHLTFIVYDGPTSRAPCCAFTGDAIFVGDVGRPDLLERAAGIHGTMEAGAKTLYQSLARFQMLPEHLLLWPGHGAGSACGKALGDVPATTLGYEIATNWAFNAPSESAFVAEVLEGQPEPPAYFATMKRVNKEGPRLIGALKVPQRLEPSLVTKLVADRAVILDTRDTEALAYGYLPGSLNVPISDRGFTTYAGSVLESGPPIYLFSANEGEALEAEKSLSLIGFDEVKGWFGPEALEAFTRSGQVLETFEELRPRALEAESWMIVDVRGASEYEEARIPGSINLPLSTLRARVNELPHDRKIAVHCAAGIRSVVAVTLLRSLGIERLANLAGGLEAYEDAGLPVETGPVARVATAL